MEIELSEELLDFARRLLEDWGLEDKNDLYATYGATMVAIDRLSLKRGRPSTNFDKRAYQREYMRRRRAKDKAEKR